MQASTHTSKTRRAFVIGAAGAVATAAMLDSTAGAASDSATAQPTLGTTARGHDKQLRIDIPVTLKNVNAVFSIASLSFEGDLPASIFHLQLIVNDVADWNATSQVVAVFHTNAGHVTLHDEAYNRDRGIATGNPYKKLITDLMARGVRVELCGATAKAHGWGNEDTILGIKINTDAMARTIQLVEQGFIKVSES